MSANYFGVGIYHPKYDVNIGTLMRSAVSFGASFIYTIGRKYKRQASDTCNSVNLIPYYHHVSFDDFKHALPDGCRIVAIEITENAIPLNKYWHKEKSCYLLGAEDFGIPNKVLEKCHEVVKIPNTKYCLNVSTAGSIVLWSRINQLVLK